MMLADAIGNVSLDSISNYAALDGHGGPLVAGGGDLVERSIRMGFEANGQAPAGCWHLMVLGLCVMIGLAIMDPALGAENKFDGVYTGKRVLTKGSNQRCPTEDDVSVTIRGEALTFTNSRLHNMSIGFEPHPDGSFDGISSTGDQGATVSI